MLKRYLFDLVMIGRENIVSSATYGCAYCAFLSSCALYSYSDFVSIIRNIASDVHCITVKVAEALARFCCMSSQQMSLSADVIVSAARATMTSSKMRSVSGPVLLLLISSIAIMKGQHLHASFCQLNNSSDFRHSSC